jgi:tetratricopeptide (TPR) repeat protein
MPSKRLLRFLIPALAAALCLPLAAQENAVTPPMSAAPLPEQVLTPKILYEFLLAEIALGRGQTSTAAAAYADLARTTHDPRVARRATEVAYYARQFPLAAELAQIWIETEPQSISAKQMYWALLAVSGRSDQLATELGRVIAAEKGSRGPALLQLGRLLSRFDDKKMAVQVVDKVTAPYLDLPEAHFVRAQAAYNAEDSAGASNELDLALKLKPDWEPAAILKAQLLDGGVEQTILYLAAFIDKYPGMRDARVAYARALIDAKRYDEAQKIFAGLLKDEPDRTDILYSLGLLSLQAGDNAAAEGYLKRVINPDFPEVDSAHFYLGEIAEEDGRGDEAIQHFDAMAMGSMHYVQGQIHAAGLMAKQGQLEGARARLQAAGQTKPKERISLLVVEAQLLSDAGKPADAYRLLDESLAKNPNEPVLLYESALLAERIDKADAMERNLRKLIKLKPDHAHAYNALGYSLVERNQRLGEAKVLIDKALSLAPQDPFILDSKGWLEFRLGALENAADALRSALSLRPDPEIAAHLGEVLWQMGRKDEAKQVWDDGLKTSPDNEALKSTMKRLGL